MRKKIGSWMMAIAIVGMGILLFGGFLASLEKDGWASGNAASWAQAISSVVAIFAAVGIMTVQQREAKRKQDRDDARQQLRLLTSIRAEVRSIYTRYMSGAGKIVGGAQKGQIFHYHYRFVPNQFHVFDSHVGQFGIIDSDEIRELLITAYGTFKNVVFLIEMNTDIIEAMQAEELDLGGTLSEERQLDFKRRLIGMADQIVDRNNEALAFADTILQKLSDSALHDLIQRTHD